MSTRIVLTGGPGAGKSVIAARLARDEPGRFAVVPEAASVVYARLDTRWDRLDDAGRRDVQRRIYRFQVEQEERAAREYPSAEVILLDRGTVDGSAYWPDGPDDYWRDLGTTHERELARYHGVVWLESCAALPGLYDGATSNARRHESADAAIEQGERVRRVWLAHPRLTIVNACADLDDKLEMVRQAIERLGTRP